MQRTTRFAVMVPLALGMSVLGIRGAVAQDEAWLRGDSNGDRSVDISDSLFTLNWLFLDGKAPACEAAADSNGDGAVDLSDPIFTLGILFLGTEPPCQPFPGCGLVSCPRPEGVIGGSAWKGRAEGTPIVAGFDPLGGMLLEITREDQVLATATTGPDGSYRITGLDTGTVRLRGSTFDGLEGTIDVEVARDKTTVVHFLQPGPGEPVVPFLTGFAVDAASPNPDLDRDGRVGLADLERARAGNPPVDPALADLVETSFGRVVLSLPALDYTASGEGPPVVFNIGGGAASGRCTQDVSTGIWETEGDPLRLTRKAVEQAGTAVSPELGEIHFQGGPSSSVFEVDLSTGRVVSGFLELQLTGELFPGPVELLGEVKDGFVALDALGFNSAYLAVSGMLVTEFPIFADPTFVMSGPCKSGDDFKPVKDRIATREALCKWILATIEDLKKESERLKNATDDVSKAHKANIDRAIENLPGCCQGNKTLDEIRECADLYLRPIQVVKAAAGLYASGFELMKAAVEAISTTFSDDEKVAWCKLVDAILDFLGKMGEAVDSADLKEAVSSAKDIKKLWQQGQKTLDELKKALEKLRDLLNR